MASDKELVAHLVNQNSAILTRVKRVVALIQREDVADALREAEETLELYDHETQVKLRDVPELVG